MTAQWYKMMKWDFHNGEIWSVGIRWYHLGIGVVRTYWGWRILLIRWQICIHTETQP